MLSIRASKGQGTSSYSLPGSSFQSVQNPQNHHQPYQPYQPYQQQQQYLQQHAMINKGCAVQRDCLSVSVENKPHQQHAIPKGRFCMEAPTEMLPTARSFDCYDFSKLRYDPASTPLLMQDQDSPRLWLCKDSPEFAEAQQPANQNPNVVGWPISLSHTDETNLKTFPVSQSVNTSLLQTSFGDSNNPSSPPSPPSPLSLSSISPQVAAVAVATTKEENSTTVPKMDPDFGFKPVTMILPATITSSVKSFREPKEKYESNKKWQVASCSSLGSSPDTVVQVTRRSSNIPPMPTPTFLVESTFNARSQQQSVPVDASKKPKERSDIDALIKKWSGNDRSIVTSSRPIASCRDFKVAIVAPLKEVSNSSDGVKSHREVISQIQSRWSTTTPNSASNTNTITSSSSSIPVVGSTNKTNASADKENDRNSPNVHVNELNDSIDSFCIMDIPEDSNHHNDNQLYTDCDIIDCVGMDPVLYPHSSLPGFYLNGDVSTKSKKGRRKSVSWRATLVTQVTHGIDAQGEAYFAV